MAAEEDWEGSRGLGANVVLRGAWRSTGGCGCVWEQEAPEGGVEAPCTG